MSQAHISQPPMSGNAPINTNRSDADKHARVLFFNLAAITLLLILMGLGVAYWLNALVASRPEQQISTFSTPTIHKNIAGLALDIPNSWINTSTSSNAEFVQTLDLELFVQLSQNAKPATINLHLASANQTQPSSHLLDNVYSLRFSPKQVNGITGLVGKPLRNEEGFQSETIWYDPISPNPFVAKCINLETPTSTPSCLRTVHVSPKLAITYQFTIHQLPHWREFDAIMLPLLQQIGIDAN